jgi:DNA helicase-2/ATP-dependent DNA helicase PcrA
LANKLARGTQQESVYALEGQVEVESLPGEREEACWIVDKIQSLLLLGSHDEIEGHITLEKMVVIGRTRFAFPALQTELEERGIPFAMNKGERQVEPTSVFGRVLDLAIRLRINPKDWVHGEKLCALLGLERRRDWGDDGLLHLLSNSVDIEEVPYGDIQVELLKAINDLDIEEPRIPKLCESFERRLTESALRSETSDGELERSLQELSDFQACWVLFRRKGLGDSLQSFRNAMALGQLTADSRSSGLILSTVHTMKGLEKDIVFLLGMCEGVFPDYRATTPKTVEEERNSAFVAITRARRWLYITYPQRRKMPWGDDKTQSPSRFLREIGRA